MLFKFLLNTEKVKVEEITQNMKALEAKNLELEESLKKEELFRQETDNQFQECKSACDKYDIGFF
jgi:hypothetical protein